MGSGSGPLPLPLWLLTHHLAGRRCVVPHCVRARPGGCLALWAPRLGFSWPISHLPRTVFTRPRFGSVATSSLQLELAKQYFRR